MTHPCIIFTTDSVSDIRLNRNHFYYCPKVTGMRIGIDSGEYANNVQACDNFAISDSRDMMSRLFYGPTAGNLTNVVVRGNYSDFVNRPVDLNTGATYVGLEVSGNSARGYGSGNAVPYGAPSGSAHRVFGNLNNGSLDYVDAAFRGVTTTTPTKFLNPGATFLSNSVLYIYTGSGWVAP